MHSKTGDNAAPDCMSVKPRLGEKGTRTRARLLAVTREMLETISPMHLTSAAIAQKANTSPATFYIYFKDVEDLLYSLTVEACSRLNEVYQSHPEWFEDRTKLHEDAEQLVVLAERVWAEFGQILIYRNLEADRGNDRFSKLRSDTAAPMLSRISKAITAGNPGIAAGDASASAVVLLAALDRICAVRYHYGLDTRGRPSPAQLQRALVNIIAQQLAPHPVTTESFPDVSR